RFGGRGRGGIASAADVLVPSPDSPEPVPRFSFLRAVLPTLRRGCGGCAVFYWHEAGGPCPGFGGADAPLLLVERSGDEVTQAEQSTVEFPLVAWGKCVAFQGSSDGDVVEQVGCVGHVDGALQSVGVAGHAAVAGQHCLAPVPHQACGVHGTVDVADAVQDGERLV